MKKKLAKFAKFLCLAQAASDAGKGFACARHNASNAVREGYGLKDAYIRQAVAEAKKLGDLVKVSTDMQYMFIIYFDIKGFGQVSFHSFHPIKNWEKYPTGVWNEWIGGSVEICKKLERAFNLQVYNR